MSSGTAVPHPPSAYTQKDQCGIFFLLYEISVKQNTIGVYFTDRRPIGWGSVK